jgi:hypothetical protein
MSVRGDFKYNYSVCALYNHSSIDVTLCLIGLRSGVEDQTHVGKKNLNFMSTWVYPSPLPPLKDHVVSLYQLPQVMCIT